MADESQELKTDKVLIVAADGQHRRLDLYVAASLPRLSRAKVQRLIDRGDITVNGATVKRRTELAAGDRVVVSLRAVEASPLTPVAMPLSILFEDEHLIVVDKPAGLSVHPGAGSSQATLVQALLAHVGSLPVSATAERDPMASLRPGIVHRLDKDTTGAMVMAKTDLAHAHLAKQFHDKKDLLREYVALLDGSMQQDEIVHESYLFRDPHSRLRFASMSVEAMRRSTLLMGRPPSANYRYAKSAFKCGVRFGGRLTLARVRLFTGRTHQIRVHARDLGMGVVGDLVYHRATELPHSFPPALRELLRGTARQMLHARLLGFRHPASGEMLRFEAPYPADFAAILNALRPYSESDDVPKGS